MLNILVVEPDFTIMQTCSVIIQTMSKNFCVFKAGSTGQAGKIINQHKIDIFFIDYRLSKADHFALTNQIRKHPSYSMAFIVFFNGVSTDALEIFKKYHCYDYVNCPFQKDTFSAVAKSLLLSCERDYLDRPDFFENKEKYIQVENGRAAKYIKRRNILFAESNLNTLKIVAVNGVCYVKRSLKEVIDYINDPCFIRCHKSYGVNVAHISELERISRHTWSVKFDPPQGEFCYISEKYYETVINILNKLKL